jgi:hypothetical protein
VNTCRGGGGKVGIGVFLKCEELGKWPLGFWGALWIGIALLVALISLVSWVSFGTSMEDHLTEGLASLIFLAQLSLAIILPSHLLVAMIGFFRGFASAKAKSKEKVGCWVVLVTIVEVVIVGYLFIYPLSKVSFG